MTKQKALIKIACLLLFFIIIIATNNPNIQHLTGLVIETLVGPSVTNVNVDFNSNIGTIRPDFYGVNTHGGWLGNASWIDINSDGAIDFPSNLSWHRQEFLDSGMTYIRWDSNLHNNYNETNNSFLFIGNLTSRIDQLKWAHDNGIRVLLIIDYMPAWLANQSMACTNLNYCPPKDYNLFSDIVIDYISRLTVNGTYASDLDVEVWNEPDISYLLDNLPNDDIRKSISYNLIYNYSYNAIKSKYPSISVGGPAISSVSDNNIFRSFLGNFSGKMDFFSFHRYTDTAGSDLLQDLQYIFNECGYYNANCNKIIISEWNTLSSSTKSDQNSVNNFAANTAAGYASVLSNYPSQVSMILFQWSYDKKYLPNINYEEYPQRWSMVSEPQLDNAIYPSYNVTKDFATYHSPGSTVVNSSSSNSNIIVVASFNGSNQYITIVNTGLIDANVSINLQGTNITNGLTDLKTGENYTFNDSIINLGVISQYTIRYLVSANVSNLIVGNNNTNQSNSTNNSSNNQTNDSSSNTDSSSSSSPPSGSGGTGGGGGVGIVTTIPITTKAITNESNGSSLNESRNEETNVNPKNIIKEISNVSENNQNAKNRRGITGFAVDPLGKGFYLITVILIASSVILVIFLTLTHYIPRRKERKEAEGKLIQWVKDAKKKRYSNAKIEEILKQNNWHTDIIRRAIDEANN